MQITELGLRPCLTEEFPVSASDQLKAIKKAERKVARHNYLNSRKKRLAGFLKKTDVAI